MNLAKLFRIAKRAAPALVIAIPAVKAVVREVKKAAKDERARKL